MNIKYKIEFFSDWHCGSGLAAGADIDQLVIKDKDKLPFVPGKTIKGLIREAIETIDCFSQKDPQKDQLLKVAFGFLDDKSSSEERAIKGTLFFSNAELAEEQKKIILKNGLGKYLYRAVASTSIDENGIAKDGSLRRTETVIPCTLFGDILDVPDLLMADIEDALLFVKRLGVNRNRGLGRCEFSIIKKEGVQE